MGDDVIVYIGYFSVIEKEQMRYLIILVSCSLKF